MTKRAKTVLKILGAGVLALLLSLCLLGVTFSRYTVTVEGGSDSVGVALWKVSSTRSNSNGRFGKVSSSMDAYSDEGARTNESQWLYTGSNNRYTTASVWTFHNYGAVKADITFTVESETFTWADGFEWGTGWTSSSDGYKESANWYYQKSVAQWKDEDGNPFTQEDFEALILEWEVLHLEFGEMVGSTIELIDKTEFYLEANTTKDVYARVVWKSIYEGDAAGKTIPVLPDRYYDSEGALDWKLFSDDVDTVLMTFLSTVGFSASWYAVQAEKILEIA